MCAFIEPQPHNCIFFVTAAKINILFENNFLLGYFIVSSEFNFKIRLLSMYLVDLVLTMSTFCFSSYLTFLLDRTKDFCLDPLDGIVYLYYLILRIFGPQTRNHVIAFLFCSFFQAAYHDNYSIQQFPFL